MSDSDFRTERDSMGELQVPADALWGAQTQRAVNTFQMSGDRMPRGFIEALARVKWAAAGANGELGLLPSGTASAIQQAAQSIIDGEHQDAFPVDVFQTGSGTSSNMNANEVIARLATDIAGRPVHPNDDVNMGQSSNDVIPTTIHVSAALAVHHSLLPALEHLVNTLAAKAEETDNVVKTGRTHLMDAMPVRMSQELTAWQTQIQHGIDRIRGTLPRVQALAQGGTAVGSGINAHPRFGAKVATLLTEQTSVEFANADSLFEALACQDTIVELSGQLRVLAVSIMKIANDLRWMNSGPLAGLGEIALPALQPGSSIMPGKVNPVIPEAAALVAAEVIGNDATITVAGQAGSF
ncbi:MAG: class II fumarate hydratase, partial [Pseudomonadota bacterium]